MGAGALQSLIFLMGFLLCSGTSVMISYDASKLPSFPAEPLQFLKQNGASHIQISDGNHGLLNALCGNRIDADVYISTENILTISKSRDLAVAWVQREVASFISCMNVTSIVVNNELIKENDFSLLLPTLKAIDSALLSLKLDQSIKLSTSFSLSFIEYCFKNPQNPYFEKIRDILVQVMDFLHRPNSFLTIGASCEGNLGLGDCLIAMVNRSISVLPDHKLQLQINLRSPPFAGPVYSVKLDNRLMSVVGDKNKDGNRLASFLVEKPWAQEFEQNEVSHEEKRLFPSYRRELIDSELDSINSMPQLDVLTPLATVPVVNPSPPTTLATPTTTTSPPPPSMTPPTMTPITTPTTTPTTSTPSSSGQWCVANPSASPTALQVALDYACGYGGADCSAIQKGGSCFNPDTVRDHASYAFNDYYQKNPVPTSCVFGGTATLTSTDPSTSTCHYPSSSSSTSTPSMGTPSVINTTNPTGSTIYGTEPPSSSDVSAGLPCFPLISTLACLLMAAMA